MGIGWHGSTIPHCYAIERNKAGKQTMTNKDIKPYVGEKLEGHFVEVDGQNYLICSCKHCGQLFLHLLGGTGRIPLYDRAYCQNRAAYNRKLAREKGKTKPKVNRKTVK